MSISDLRTRVRCPGAVLAGKLVTCVEPYTVDYDYKTYQRIYIQEPSAPFGIGVLLGPLDPLNPPDMPQVGNKITVTGTLMPLGMETLLMSPSGRLTTAPILCPDHCCSNRRMSADLLPISRRFMPR